MKSTLPGHCELFAGSLALLSRAAGFPSRVAAGFKGGTWNGFENYYMVTNAEAHAWCEIYDGQSTWFRADPTPGAGGAASDALADASGATRRVDRSLRAWFDSLQVIWYRRIVSFDQRSQYEMIQSMQSVLAKRPQLNFGAISERVRNWLHSPWSMRRAVGWIAGMLIAAAAVAWSLCRGLRSWKKRRSTRKREFDPVRREAGRWLGRLRMAHGKPAELDRGTRIDAWDELTRLRFGAKETWPEFAPVFRRARRAVRELRRRG